MLKIIFCCIAILFQDVHAKSCTGYEDCPGRSQVCRLGRCMHIFEARRLDNAARENSCTTVKCTRGYSCDNGECVPEKEENSQTQLPEQSLDEMDPSENTHSEEN